MAHPSNLRINELSSWLLRLALVPSVNRLLVQDAVFFATWYAVIYPVLIVPHEIEAIQSSARSKELSLEESLRLLEQLNHNVKGGAKSERVNEILEGYAVHQWIRSHVNELDSMIEQSLVVTDEREEALNELEIPVLSPRINGFIDRMGFTRSEVSLFTVAVVCGLFTDFAGILSKAFGTKASAKVRILAAMLNLDMEELHQALSPTGILRKSRLLDTQSEFGTPRIADFWLKLFLDETETIFESLVQPLKTVSSTGIPAKLSKEDQTLAADILKNAIDSRKEGVNLLLYGADSFDKRGQLIELLESAQAVAYVLREQESSAWKEQGAIAYVAQRYLANEGEPRAVLIVEKPSQVLERKPSDTLRAIFGLEAEVGSIQPMDELLLENNPVVAIWAGPGSDSLNEECVSRFMFHAPLKRGSREDRREQLQRYAKHLKLSRGAQKELLGLEDVSAKQLEVALEAAKLSGATTKASMEAALIRTVKRSLAALKRDTSAAAKECVTEYSLKYLNYSGKFGPEQILKALRLRPKGSICIYGPPGTGKTQFVEHLAQKLGTRLISKRASDLLSKWVGDNEKNIAEMFQEAEAQEAILFLDEGDSFLRDRNQAEASWEISKVNELLQCMERFSGIFIVATNLFRGLDAAALRRFTFKMELRALRSEQRWEMFTQETGIKGNAAGYSKAQKDAWRGALTMMHQLAAGDFATVKRQCILLGETLTPSQWVEQLQIECDLKQGAQVKESPAFDEVPAAKSGTLMH